MPLALPSWPPSAAPAGTSLAEYSPPYKSGWSLRPPCRRSLRRKRLVMLMTAELALQTMGVLAWLVNSALTLERGCNLSLDTVRKETAALSFVMCAVLHPEHADSI